MYHRIFLVYTLLSCCAGESSVHSSSEKILAFEGGNVILPCSFNITASSDFPTVEWSKEGLQPNVIFLYRDGCETYEMKNPAFEYRTSFIVKELKNGNISLRISNVRWSDAGRYQCMQLWKNAPRDITAVELIVGAVSEPKLSVVSGESWDLTLQCEVNYSLPEPEIKFMDDQGNKIPAEDPKREQDASGCYTLRQRMTLQTATNSVTCRVQQPEFNLVRDTQILIPADFMRFCRLIIAISVGGAILLLVFVCGFAVCLWKRRSKAAKEQNLLETRRALDQSTQNGISDNQSLLELSNVADGADSVLYNVIEKLDKEVTKSVIQRQDSNPAPEHRIQRKSRNNSSPARLSYNDSVLSSSSSISSSKKNLGHIDRSRSQPNPNRTKLQRRHSSVFPSSHPPSNCYIILADVTEDS